VTDYVATTTTTADLSSIEVVTTTSITTEISTVTALPTFKLQAFGTGIQDLDGQYVSVQGGIEPGGSWGMVYITGTDIGAASNFSLDAQSLLTYNGSYADENAGVTGGMPIYIDPLIYLVAPYYDFFTCDISTGYLSCSCQGNTVFVSCLGVDDNGQTAGVIWLKNTATGSQNCVGVSLEVILVP
jgi:hypothetical protein